MTQQELDGADIASLGIVEAIIRAPLEQATMLAIGRASTCWLGEMPQGIFDEQTATQIGRALVTRVQQDVEAAVARARGMDETAVLIPRVPVPTEARDRAQCPARVRLEGAPVPSRCLLLEGGHDEHQNGSLHWRIDPAGVIDAWWRDDAYRVMTLGDLLRAERIHLTIPHLPAEALEEARDARAAIESGASVVVQDIDGDEP